MLRMLNVNSIHNTLHVLGISQYSITKSLECRESHCIEKTRGVSEEGRVKSEESNCFVLFLKSATIIQYTIKGRFMSR